jgi:hypothetical protein
MPAKFRKEAIAALPPDEQEKAVEDSYYAYHKAVKAAETANRPRGHRQMIKEKYKAKKGKNILDSSEH